MANSTIIHIPDNIDDKVVLRRTLDKLVQAIDELKGNRGNDEAAKASQLVSTATSLEELRKDFNKLDLNYVRSDGKGVITAPLTYDKSMVFGDKDLISKEEAEKLVKDTTEQLDDYVVKDTQVAPNPLPANATLADVITAFNGLLVTLKNTKLLS